MLILENLLQNRNKEVIYSADEILSSMLSALINISKDNKQKKGNFFEEGMLIFRAYWLWLGNNADQNSVLQLAVLS